MRSLDVITRSMLDLAMYDILDRYLAEPDTPELRTRIHTDTVKIVQALLPEEDVYAVVVDNRRVCLQLYELAMSWEATCGRC